VDNPADGTNPWILSTLFNATRPITAAVALSVDYLDEGLHDYRFGKHRVSGLIWAISHEFFIFGLL
jgi:hypothetical protein